MDFMKRFTKRFLSLLLCLILGGSVCGSAVAACSGDLTGDNKIGTADARNILRAAVGLDQLNAAAKQAADMNLDGAVTTADARLALRVAVGLEVTDGKLYTNEYDVLRSGFFFADFAVKDASGEQTMVLAVAGDASYLSMEFTDEELMQEFGMDAIRIDLLFEGKTAYLLDKTNRLYAEFPFEAMEMDPSEVESMSEAKDMFSKYPALDQAASKATAAFNGVTCTVYTFNYTDGSSLEVFMNGAKVMGIVEHNAKGEAATTYTFNTVTLTVPKEYISIPAAYTEGDAMEMLLLLFFGGLMEELDL